MCSTNDPKIRRGTSPTTKSRSRVTRARDMELLGACRWGGSLAAEAGGGEALDDLALEEEEDDDQRDGREHGRGHDLRVLQAVGALHGLQPDGHRHERRVA